MKSLVVVVWALALLPGVLTGCGDSPRQAPGKEKPIAAMKHHDTRVLVICKDSRGAFYKKSLHKSESVTCGDTTFKLEDFSRIGENDCYVAFPGQEKELELYLKLVQEQQK